MTDAKGQRRLEKSFDHGRLINRVEWGNNGRIIREEATPLREGISLAIDAGEDVVTETIEIPAPPAEEEGLGSVGFRYRLSSADPELPADATRTFRVSLLQGGTVVEYSDFEGEPGGWSDYQERFEISPGEALAIKVRAAPGVLTVDLAGLTRLDQLEPGEE